MRNIKRVWCVNTILKKSVDLQVSFVLKGASVEAAIRKYGDNDIRWSSQGMLRLTLDAMRKLFMPTVQKIKETIGDALNHPSVRGKVMIDHLSSIKILATKDRL